ncbi:MAG: nucleoside triphosphate pyrophosphatase [Candidatus Baltobacteraceae bacterium]
MASVINSLVLASQSPRRLELLRSLGLDVRVRPSRYPEPDRPDLAPRELALEHARKKCADVASAIADPSQIILAADTVVDVDGAAYNKPRDEADARRMLRDLSGRTHVVHTAIAFVAEGGMHEYCESTRVTFFALDEQTIAAYAASGEPMDKAGAYGIQGYGATLVERIEGDFYTVMGLPLARFTRMLSGLGFALPITKQGSTTV